MAASTRQAGRCTRADLEGRADLFRNVAVEGDVPASVGRYRSPKQEIDREAKAVSEAALRACTQQTGMTRAECIADAAAGNAN
jgi:hypothetical protein